MNNYQLHFHYITRIQLKDAQRLERIIDALYELKQNDHELEQNSIIGAIMSMQSEYKKKVGKYYIPECRRIL